MEKLIAFVINSDNSKTYISNVSPLLWTDKRENAKVFNSNSEFKADISAHFSSLNSILKETGQILHVQMIE